VSVSFLAEQSEPSRGRWFWSYHVRIENGGGGAVQLVSREWTIVDGRGARHEVIGEGVVGEQPVIEPDGSFDYVSGCPLGTPERIYGGAVPYGRRGRARVFAVAIPRFPPGGANGG
jgi:ApaG protein